MLFSFVRACTSIFPLPSAIPGLWLQPEVGQFLTHHVYGVIISQSLSALPFHPAGGDVHMSFDQVILLLSLVGGSIYATASLTIKILEHLQKKKD